MRLWLVLGISSAAFATDPPTCQLSNKNGRVHQTVCYGETVKITATTSDENAAVQWHRQNNTGGWTAVSGATQSNLTTGPGIYKADLLFPIQLLAQVQVLPPGTYHDLKPTRPLVLQKGEYVFINLTMRHLGKGIWLDARKARSLTLIHCQFEGNGSGTAVATNNHASITNCIFKKLEKGIWATVLPKPSKKKPQSRTGNTFSGLDYGIMVPSADLVSSPQAMPYTVRGNTFIDNDYGVYLGGGNINIDFRCNQFRLSCMDDYPTSGPAVNNSAHPCYNEFTNGPARIGLFVGEDVNIFGDIGGPGNGNPLPAGNVWPVGNRSQEEIELSSYELTGWVHPPNFTAVVNESEESWTYYYFGNEFYNYLDNSISGALNFPTTGIRYAQTSGSQSIPSALTGLVDLVCDDVFSSIVFPLRPVGSGGTDLTAAQTILRNDEPILGQNVPNPAMHTTTISFYTPTTVQKTRLEVFELETGRLLKGFDIWRPGHGAIEFETRSLPSGMLGYRLVTDGLPVAHKKMVITH